MYGEVVCVLCMLTLLLVPLPLCDEYAVLGTSRWVWSVSGAWTSVLASRWMDAAVGT